MADQRFPLKLIIWTGIFCCALAVPSAWAQNGRIITSSSQPPAAARRGLIESRPQNTGPFAYAIVGEVKQSAVYSSHESWLPIDQLISAAGGLTPDASPVVRVVRNGELRFQMHVVPDQPDPSNRVLPNDVIIVSARQATAGNAGIVPIACLGLTKTPVVLPLDPSIQSIAELTRCLAQPAVVAQSAALIGPGSSARQLTAGCVVVFDPRLVDPEPLRLPDMIPPALDMEQARTSAAPGLVAGTLHTPTPAPPVSLQNRLLAQGSSSPARPGLQVPDLSISQLNFDAAATGSGSAMLQVQAEQVQDLFTPEDILPPVSPQPYDMARPAAIAIAAPPATPLSAPPPIPMPTSAAQPPEAAMATTTTTPQRELEPVLVRPLSTNVIVEPVPEPASSLSSSGFHPTTASGSGTGSETSRATALPVRTAESVLPQDYRNSRQEKASPAERRPLSAVTAQNSDMASLSPLPAEQSGSLAWEQPLSILFGAGLMLGGIMAMTWIWAGWQNHLARVRSEAGAAEQAHTDRAGQPAAASSADAALASRATSGAVPPGAVPFGTVSPGTIVSATVPPGLQHSIPPVTPNPIQQLIHRTVPVVEEQIQVPNEWPLHGLVIGHRRHILHSAHETIAGPHFSRRDTQTAREKVPVQAHSLDERTLRSRLRAAMSPASDSQELPAQTPSVPDDAVFRPASKERTVAAARVAASSGSDREADHELDIVQPQDPAPAVAMSPLERALRTLASEKFG